MNPVLAKNIIDGAGLVGAILFIMGLKGLSNPATARRGDQLGIYAMIVAVGASLLDPNIHSGNFIWIFLTFAVGAVPAYMLSKKVAMTAMPQMVAFFNGMGGGAAALVSAVTFIDILHPAPGGTGGESPITALLGTIIGSITLTGSIIAWGKLQQVLSGRPITYPGQKIVNALAWAAVIVLGLWCGLQVSQGNLSDPNVTWGFVLMMVLAGLIGVGMVLPIGGADMPVVISLLNSFTGLACALTGFSVHSYVLVIAGMLVGSSGTLLTLLMCKAMNRSLANVLFGAFGGGGEGGAGGGAAVGGDMKEISVEDLAPLLAYSRNVVIVPGYGMAVAQAQQTVRELSELLEKKGVDVKYAIHPVAGRMPGHMNVLLAEANVPYPQLFDMEDINPEFDKTDVALVIGANDVTNPAARTDPQSPIYGMPILDVDHAKTVVVMKRGRGTGFAGVENGLYTQDNTRMLFGDAKATLARLVAEVKTQ